MAPTDGVGWVGEELEGTACEIRWGGVDGGGVNVGDMMFTSYTSGCHGRQAASLLVLILQHRHGTVTMVTSSREREGEVK